MDKSIWGASWQQIIPLNKDDTSKMLSYSSLWMKTCKLQRHPSSTKRKKKNRPVQHWTHSCSVSQKLRSAVQHAQTACAALLNRDSKSKPQIKRGPFVNFVFCVPQRISVRREPVGSSVLLNYVSSPQPFSQWGQERRHKHSELHSKHKLTSCLRATALSTNIFLYLAK